MTLHLDPARMAGRTAMVTGASSGIGRDLSLNLAASGARVVVAARRRDRLKTLVDEIAAQGGVAAAVQMDVAQERSVCEGFAAAQKIFGPVDTFYGNAGVTREGSAMELAANDFDALMGVNLRGVFLTAREAARQMIAGGAPESGRGRIVLVASIAAHTVLPGHVAYCASKAGVAMFGKGLARELARKGVNVNVVCPGFLETELTSDWFASEGGRRQIQSFPRRRLMQASDLAETLLFLGSDAARGVTGAVFTLDDGQSL